MQETRPRASAPMRIETFRVGSTSWPRLPMPSILASPRHAFIAAIGAFAALHAVSSLSMPLGWDHGMLASVGVELARGEMPYRDSWELKSPLAFLPYAVAYLLFGNVMWGVRLIDLAILVPMLSCFMRVVRSETDPVIG